MNRQYKLQIKTEVTEQRLVIIHSFSPLALDSSNEEVGGALRSRLTACITTGGKTLSELLHGAVGKRTDCSEA